jgi:hypothetical protein
MRGGGGGEGEQQEQQKINTGLINPINSLLPDQAINSTISKMHTHTNTAQNQRAYREKEG